MDGRQLGQRIDERLAHPVVDFVVEITRKNYPDLKIPFHSRWGHFKVGGIDRLARIMERVADRLAAPLGWRQQQRTEVVLTDDAGERMCTARVTCALVRPKKQ